MTIDNPVLIAREGQLSGQRWTLEKETLIGRGAECQIVLPERQVSRHHARIKSEMGRYVLYDLDSKNGTHLNGVRVISDAPLQDGDEVQIALCVKLVFVGSDATLPLTFDPPRIEGNLLLDTDQRSVVIDDKELNPPLSLAQFRLLQTLYEADGAVCDRDSIIEAVWPGTEGIGVSEQAIDALVRRLRDRLVEIDSYNYIVTVRGHGFRLDNGPH